MSRDLENELSHHVPPNTNVNRTYSWVRIDCLKLGSALQKVCPESHELDVALDKLNEVMFWANAAIARHPDKLGANNNESEGPCGCLRG